MGRTCGEPDEIKKNTHPKNIIALFGDHLLRLDVALVDHKVGGGERALPATVPTPPEVRGVRLVHHALPGRNKVQLVLYAAKVHPEKVHVLLGIVADLGTIISDQGDMRVHTSALFEGL